MIPTRVQHGSADGRASASPSAAAAQTRENPKKTSAGASASGVKVITRHKMRALDLHDGEDGRLKGQLLHDSRFER
jgi:hypothetical protein